jgi:hypothetical protein
MLLTLDDVVDFYHLNMWYVCPQVLFFKTSPLLSVSFLNYQQGFFIESQLNLLSPRIQRRDWDRQPLFLDT